MSDLIRSVAGVRGIWAESLYPATAVKYATAFGNFLNFGKVLIGRDTRTTGDIIKHASISGLLAAGCEIIDIGVAPTPTCQIMVKEFNCAGGLIITASHNPINWNGLKFLSSAGEFLDESKFKEFMEIVDSGKLTYRSASEYKPDHKDQDLNKQAIEKHITKICNYIDVEAIRKKRYKVIIDAVNGAGSRLHIPLLERLGCSTIKLSCMENGLFPRVAEPLPENLTELCSLVKKEKADIGFAVDPDADRLSIVSEKGEALGEEKTLPLVAQHLLKKKGGVTVTNLSTSMAIDFVAKNLNTKVIRTKIGEANVVSGMKKHNCFVGGEGNGGVIIPEIHYARDSGIGVGIILEYLAKTNSKISELANTIPELFFVKRKIDCAQDKIPGILEHFKNKYKSEQVSTLDGIKVIWKDSWIHLRKSGTEGILRVFAEATTSERANNLIANAMEQVNSILTP